MLLFQIGSKWGNYWITGLEKISPRHLNGYDRNMCVRFLGIESANSINGMALHCLDSSYGSSKVSRQLIGNFCMSEISTA